MTCGDGSGLACTTVTCPSCHTTYCTTCSACACSLEAEIRDD